VGDETDVHPGFQPVAIVSADLPLDESPELLISREVLAVLGEGCLGPGRGVRVVMVVEIDEVHGAVKNALAPTKPQAIEDVSVVLVEVEVGAFRFVLHLEMMTMDIGPADHASDLRPWMVVFGRAGRVRVSIIHPQQSSPVLK